MSIKYKKFSNGMKLVYQKTIKNHIDGYIYKGW